LFESAFSDELISQLGCPELSIVVGEEGVDAPTSVAPGFYHVTLSYDISQATASTAPQVWKFDNAGEERSHHIVIFRVPDGTTKDVLIAEYMELMAGIPPAADGLDSQLVWSGYGAMQSPGTTTWTEFDFTPGTYADICFIRDEEMSIPYMMDGMITRFTVEGGS
jgi:hypothetical protein